MVYMTFSDKLIEGSAKNSTSTVPIQPGGGRRQRPAKMCGFHALKQIDDQLVVRIFTGREGIQTPLTRLRTACKATKGCLWCPFHSNPSPRCQLLAGLV